MGIRQDAEADYAKTSVTGVSPHHSPMPAYLGKYLVKMSSCGHNFFSLCSCSSSSYLEADIKDLKLVLPSEALLGCFGSLVSMRRKHDETVRGATQHL